MPYITTAERIGIQKGRQEAILEILEFRLGKVDDAIAAEIRQIQDPEKLRNLLRQASAAPEMKAFQKAMQEEG